MFGFLSAIYIEFIGINKETTETPKAFRIGVTFLVFFGAYLLHWSSKSFWNEYIQSIYS
jgi:hypothetical protein